MTLFLFISYLYVGIGMFCGYTSLIFLKPTDKQLKNMKEDKVFWDYMKRDMEDMQKQIEDFPQLVYIVTGLVILTWPYFLAQIFLGRK